MISFIVPFILLLISFTTHAISGRVSIKPTKPLIVNGDVVLNPGRRGQQVIQGPWFKAFYGITNFEERHITVKSLKFEIVSAEGHVDHFEFDLAKVTELSPGETVQVQDIYIGPLPNSASTKYNVTVSFQGWFGTIDNPEAPLAEQGNFQTV